MVLDSNASTSGEMGIGKESAVKVTYEVLLWVANLSAHSNRVVSLESAVESESPGYAKGVPIGVTSNCSGKPETVDNGISPSDETGEPLPVP